MFTSIRKVPHILLEIISVYLQIMGFPGGSVTKNPPATQENQEIRVRSVGQEDPLEEKMAIYSSILARKIHGQRSLEGHSPWGCKELDMTEHILSKPLRTGTQGPHPLMLKLYLSPGV